LGTKTAGKAISEMFPSLTSKRPPSLYPMSPQTWELYMQTLKLWQPHLVAAEQTSD
jgi:hypothetical protein